MGGCCIDYQKIVYVDKNLAWNILQHVKKGNLSPLDIKKSEKQLQKIIRIEPSLLLLSEESLSKRTSNIQENARVDLSASGFWITEQMTFFDLRVFNPLTIRCCEKKP